VRETKTLKLLLVEDELDDEQLLREALLEIEENRLWCNWRSSSVVPADCLSDALSFVRRDSFDAILLNLSLPDSPALLDSFLDMSACAGSAPVVVLADQADENLANRLLREGAQDVLIKSEIECAPLARAIRYAIERQRRASTLPATAFVDDLTGVLTRGALLHAVAYRGAVELLAWVEVSADRAALDPLLIQAAETLRAAFPPPSIVGRWDKCRFCVIPSGHGRAQHDQATVEAILRNAANSIVGLQFSLKPISPDEDLEELLATKLHLLAKTAILAD
jgi:CheY-like chemotaxis protein